MMAWLVGPSNFGKSTVIRKYLLPNLLQHPRAIWGDAAPQKFNVCFVIDTPTPERPKGEYPGLRYRDTSEWLRRKDRSLVSVFSHADVAGLCKLAWEKVPRSLLVLDELDACMPSPGPGKRALTATEIEICNRGRKSGVGIIGTSRRWMSVNVEFRGNAQYVYINGISNSNDVKAAAEVMNFPVRVLMGMQLKKGTFIEWNRPHDGAVNLVNFDKDTGRRVVLASGRDAVAAAVRKHSVAKAV